MSIRSRSLPRDFVNEQQRPDPNLVLGAHFTIIANRVLAIATLVEAGLEMDARPLLRTLQELCCLTLAISSDKRIFIDYHAAQGPAQERNNFYRHLTPRKLNRAVAALEKKLDFMDGVMAEERQKSYEFYTGSVHLPFVGLVSAFAGSLDDDSMSYALFGSASAGSKRLLFNTVLTTWHALTLFGLIVTKLHGRSFPLDNELIAVAAGKQAALDSSMRVLLDKIMSVKPVPGSA